jgi:hypothetical protein
MLRRIIQTVLQKTRYVLYLFWERFSFRTIQAAKDISIDVIIPVIETDLAVLPLCIEGLRKNINHTIKDIYLVSPNIAAIKDFALAHGVTFLDETTLFDYTPASINYIITAGRHEGLNRSGWIYQQLVKLSGRAGTSRYYLATDADHILLQPHTFITNDNRSVFYQSAEYNIPYYRAIKKLLGFYPLTLFSYVSHKMLFDKEQLKELQLKIETNAAGKQSWDRVIISNLSSDEVSDFSEFELYGNFVPAEKKILLPWKEKMLAIDKPVSYDELQRLYPGKLSVTIPYYQRNKKNN